MLFEICTQKPSTQIIPKKSNNPTLQENNRFADILSKTFLSLKFFMKVYTNKPQDPEFAPIVALQI